jgi:hypothetical protein
VTPRQSVAALRARVVHLQSLLEKAYRYVPYIDTPDDRELAKLRKEIDKELGYR